MSMYQGTLDHELRIRGYAHRRDPKSGIGHHLITRDGRLVTRATAHEAWDWLRRLDRKASKMAHASIDGVQEFYSRRCYYIARAPSAEGRSRILGAARAFVAADDGEPAIETQEALRRACRENRGTCSWGLDTARAV